MRAPAGWVDWSLMQQGVAEVNMVGVKIEGDFTIVLDTW